MQTRYPFPLPKNCKLYKSESLIYFYPSSTESPHIEHATVQQNVNNRINPGGRDSTRQYMRDKRQEERRQLGTQRRQETPAAPDWLLTEDGQDLSKYEVIRLSCGSTPIRSGLALFAL